MPVPLAPPVIVIHGTLLTDVQEQAVPVPTDRLPVLGVDGTDTLVVERLYTHCACALRASSARASAISTQQRRNLMVNRIDWGVRSEVHVLRRWETGASGRVHGTYERLSGEPA